jgi:HTH-type transcriptional regulator/antitoxin HigA
MEIRVIKTAEQYETACSELYQFMQSSAESIDPESETGKMMELLTVLIEKYEREHYPIDPPDPVAAILFRMDQMNLKQKDLAPYFGGKTKISEVLNRKRPLSLRTITLLHENLGIPLESLVRSKHSQILQDCKAQ